MKISISWQSLETWGSGLSWRPMMGGQPGQSLTHSGGIYKIRFFKDKHSPGLRERTRDTSYTLEATQELLVTAWLAVWLAVPTMVWSSPPWTETMTHLAPTVQRIWKEAGGSICKYKYLNFTKKCNLTFTLWLIFSCGRSNLNGVRYTDPKPPSRAHGIMWYHWLGDHYSLKSSTMMIMSKKGSF